jgi:transcriptional regulator with XRE-family HTH domain
MQDIDLKAFRKANKLSQIQLAEFLGVGQSFISQVELGSRPLPQEHISKILANKEWNTSMLVPKSNIELLQERLDRLEQARQGFRVQSVKVNKNGLEQYIDLGDKITVSRIVDALTESNRQLMEVNRGLLDKISVLESRVMMLAKEKGIDFES